MVITVEGYGGKRNRSALVASVVAAMSAMKYGEKTLAINLVDSYADSLERLMLNSGSSRTESKGSNVSEDGIDQLLREAEVKKLLKTDFDKYVTPVLNIDNRLDVATLTKNDLFTQQLPSKQEALMSLLQQAKEIYENIILYLEPTAIDLDNAFTLIDSLVDTRIVCVRQGCPKKYDVTATGKLVYLVTDYDEKSRYGINQMSKNYIGSFNLSIGAKKEIKACKRLAYNTQANDACISGTVLKFVRMNREPVAFDVNSGWVKNAIELCNFCFDKRDVVTSVDWEQAEFLDDFAPKKLIAIADAPLEVPVERTSVDFNKIPEEEVESKPSHKQLRKKMREEKEELRRKEEERRKKEAEEELNRKRELERIEAERKAREDAERLERELAEAMARKREEEERLEREEEERKKREEEERLRREEEERRRREEEERLRREAEEAKRKAEEEKKRQAEEEILRLRQELAEAQQRAAEATLALEQTD